MQNYTPFWIFVTSRFINGFFRKNSHPPIRYKGRSLQGHSRNYHLGVRMFFLEYISDNRDRCPIVLFSEKKKEMNADVPESRKLRNCWAQTVFLFVPPRWHVNLLSKVHQSMQKHHTKLVNKTGPHLSKVTSPLLRDWGWKLDKMKKWSLFW